MNKERVLFLVFHNRCHRIILGFYQLLHQLVIEVAADFTGSVENHGCFIPQGACRPVREGWGFRASVAGKVDPGGGHTLLQTVCFARDIAYGDAVDVMEYERNLGTNDANAEYVGALRAIFDDAKVNWQTAELGKVDVGGGGTIAYIMSLYGMEVIDSGVPVLSMHAPWEVTSKADVYEAKKAYVAFLKNA